MLILIKSFDSVKEASLLKTRLKENGIEAYANDLTSVYENHDYPAGHAIAVKEEFFEKALQVLNNLEKEEQALSPNKLNCPNCGSRSLKSTDLLKGDLSKILAYCRSSFGAVLRINSAKYLVCHSCGLEYTKSF
jgi:transcription elongation factor Elf1